MKTYSLLALALVTAAHVAAQSVDTETNDTCLTAQAIGAWTPTHRVLGQIDPTDGIDDIDFYRFEGEAGMAFRLVLEGRSGEGLTPLDEPLLALFGSDCTPTSWRPTAEHDEVVIDFDIPADGIFIVAAAGCCDSGFRGRGDSVGDYELRVEAPPPPVESIFGRTINRATTEPLQTDVTLYRCEGDELCSHEIGTQTSGEDGTFEFDATNVTEILEEGRYRVVATLGGYKDGEKSLEAKAGERNDAGDVPLAPPPVFVKKDLTLTCGERVCRVRTTIRNDSQSTLEGLAWAVVELTHRDEDADATKTTAFEASRRRMFALEPQSSALIRLSFRIPVGAADSADMKVTLRIGNRPRAFYNVIYDESVERKASAGDAELR